MRLKLGEETVGCVCQHLSMEGLVGSWICSFVSGPLFGGMDVNGRNKEREKEWMERKIKNEGKWERKSGR